MPEPTDPSDRRQFLTRAAILAAGAPTLAAPSSRPARKSGPSSSDAEPDARRAGQPGHVGHRRGQQADRRRARAREGRTLKIYNYADYLSPARGEVLRGQVRRQGRDLDVQRRRRGAHQARAAASTSTSTTPTTTEISRLVNGGLVRPLNHSYIPNIKNVWPSFTNPWYDQELALHRAVHDLHHRHRLAHRPGARRHRRARRTPTTSLWDPQYKGKTAIIDDWHTAMAMVLLRNGITDVNTVLGGRPEDGRRATHGAGRRPPRRR